MVLALIASLMIGTCFGWISRASDPRALGFLAAFSLVVCAVVSALFGWHGWHSETPYGAIALGLVAGLVSFFATVRRAHPTAQ